MKIKTALLIVLISCLSLTACIKQPEHEDSVQESQTERADDSLHSESTTGKTEEPSQKSIELVGPWHLGSKKNDLTALSDRFQGYAEWGASMEIRSDGKMSWYIGAEGWHGTYIVDGETIHAELDSDLEDLTLPWNFRIVIENESAIIEMDYEDMTFYWVYGDQEDPANETDNESGISPKIVCGNYSGSGSVIHFFI